MFLGVTIPKTKGKVVVLSEIDCTFILKGEPITAGRFCAIANNPLTLNSICEGDLSGPAVRQVSGTSKNQWVQEGITSFKNLDCSKTTRATGLYTRVSKYVNWIVDYAIISDGLSW